MGSAPKPPPPSAEEKAMTRRQRMRLDAEIAENERRLKAMAQKKFGKQSLLAMPTGAAPAKDTGPDITEGFIRTPSGRIKKKPKGRGSKSIAERAARMGRF